MQRPAARVSSPAPLAERPQRAKPSSPTRNSVTNPSKATSEEGVTAFPSLETTLVSTPETAQSPPNRVRRRSASIRSGGAVEAAQKRDAQIAAPVPKTHSRPSAFREEFASPSLSMPRSRLPKPGPAKLKPNSEKADWLQAALRNQYLPEHIMKNVCEEAKRILMEGIV